MYSHDMTSSPFNRSRRFNDVLQICLQFNTTDIAELAQCLDQHIMLNPHREDDNLIREVLMDVGTCFNSDNI